MRSCWQLPGTNNVPGREAPLGETGPEPPFHGFLSNWLRMVVGFVTFGGLGTLYYAVALLALPSVRLRRAMARVYANVASGLVLRIIGCELDVAEPAPADVGPAIFVLNHASALDAFVLMAVWPPKACAVGKKEVIWYPFFGIAFWLAGNLFIDRGDHEQAVEAMARLTRRVHAEGLNLWIAPEGTRQYSGRLGPFKKGFVHLALATRLPVRPIVIHDAHRIWPNRTFRLAPGTVRVEVLDAIPTDDWSADTVDEHVRQLRAVYAEALQPHQRPLEL